MDRNLLKRRMREAYRTQKSILYNAAGDDQGQILLACLYTTDVILSFDEINTAMRKGLNKLASRMNAPAKSASE